MAYLQSLGSRAVSQACDALDSLLEIVCFVFFHSSAVEKGQEEQKPQDFQGCQPDRRELNTGFYIEPNGASEVSARTLGRSPRGEII